MTERTEALYRVLVLIVSGIILGLWTYVIEVVALIHWLYVLVTGKRMKEFAEFNNQFASYGYRYVRYIGGTTNARPFPFVPFGKVMEPTDMKAPKR